VKIGANQVTDGKLPYDERFSGVVMVVEE